MSFPERASDPSRAIVTKADVEQAQDVINAWRLHIGPGEVEALEEKGLLTHKHLAHLRGLITQALTDAHAAGFDQGVDRGRRLIGNRLRDIIEDEGL